MLQLQSVNRATKNKNKHGFVFFAFAWLAVVKPSEGLVFGDVRVEELEGVLWDDPVWDHFVVSYDVSKRESTKSVLSVGLHRIKLHFSCWEKSLLAKNSIRLCNNRSESQLAYITSCKLMKAAAQFVSLFTATKRVLTIVLVLHPGEGDATKVALTEA